MVTDNRIFSRNFAVYGRLQGDTVRKRAVFRRNLGYRNTTPYTTLYLCRIGSYACRISLQTVVKHRPVLRYNTVR